VGEVARRSPTGPAPGAAVPLFTPRASGLLVPTGLERDREVWLHDDLKVLRRLITRMRPLKVRVVLLCEACQQQLEEERGTGRLCCRCKVRETR